MTSTALATGKLGKLSVRTDVRTLRLAQIRRPGRAADAARRIDLTANVGEWPMYANDTRATARQRRPGT